jgi:hypothetical protein
VTEEPEAPGASGDDPSIPDDEVLYRRLSYDNGDWVVRHLVTGERVRPTSGAFNPDPDGVSVYRQSRLLALTPPLSAADLVVSPENIVVSFTVSDVRSIRLGVRDDQWPQDVPDLAHPRNAAHALIVGLNELGKSVRRKQQGKLANVPSMKFVHG